MLIKLKLYINMLLLVFLFSTCESNFIPKPIGYFRIALPKKEYIKKKFNCPFSFEIPKYSRLEIKNNNSNEYCWFTIDYQTFKSKLFVTYKPVNNSLSKLIEENHQLTFEHQIKANSIEPTIIQRDSSKVYGLLYDVSGEVASAVQFYATDSTRHFLRGSLYFDVAPNQDSLAPVINFLREDVLHLLNTVEWEK